MILKSGKLVDCSNKKVKTGDVKYGLLQSGDHKVLCLESDIQTITTSVVEKIVSSGNKNYYITHNSVYVIEVE